MGSNFQKCGDILINISTVKKKKKLYAFHCDFCSYDCDQLKKFYKHLGDEHLNNFEEALENPAEQQNVPVILFGAEEIKLEDQIHIQQINDENFKKNINTTKNLIDYKDPLEMVKSWKNINKILSRNMTTNVNDEQEEIFKQEVESYGVLSNKFDNNSDTNDSGKDDVGKSFSYSLKDSHKCSDDSRDADFILENDINTSKHHKTFKKDSIQNDIIKTWNSNKLRRRGRRPIFESLLPTLIQQYKKYEILWKVDNIAFGVKHKKYEVYTKIAEEIKLDYEGTISLDDINYHINYLNQLYSKDKEQELKCKLEKKDFVPEYEFYNDMSFLSDSQGPFLCSICHEILPRYDPYCQHIAHHSGTPPFKCPSCELTFTKYHKYVIHKKRHLGIWNFHCDVCGKGYLFKNDLDWHVTSHTGDKPFLCQICGAGFRARHGYDNHIRRHEERFRYECHICKRGFNHLHALNCHVKSHLNIRDVICKICGKGFTHSKYLKRHELIHGEAKHYKCITCGKAFFQACGLRAHRKSHHV